MQLMKKRAVIICLCFIACFILLTAKAGYIQLVQKNELSRMALARNTELLAGEDFFRGDILDSRGESLTGAYSANRVVVFPSAVEDKEYTVQALAEILGKRYSELSPYFDGAPCYLPFELPEDKEIIVKGKNFQGVEVLPIHFRYGASPLASHITGHLGKITSEEKYDLLNKYSRKHYKFDDLVGVMGVEKYYENYLKGNFPQRYAFLPVDARERLINKDFVRTGLHPDPGRYDLVTTIDKRVQDIVEKVMDSKIEKGAVVVMKTGSGNIVASASRPDFNPDPEFTGLYDYEEGTFVNRAFSYYQPGSLFKTVLACAALEEGTVEIDTKFHCRGDVDSPVCCWYGPGHGEISFAGAVIHSCNPAFVQLGGKLGSESIIEYAEKLGLAENKITGLPEYEKNDLYKSIGGKNNLANSSIGQGDVMATPVQLTAVMNTIASGGEYWHPRIVKKLTSEQSGHIEFPASEPEKVLSRSTAASIDEILQEVVKKGTGQNARLENNNVKIAGKTGSAQVTGKEGEYINAWFSGYALGNNSGYVVTVLVENGESGGDTAAPVFKEIVLQLLRLGLLN